MAILKKVGILSAAKIQGLFGFLIGILIGLMYALMGMFLPETTGLESILFSFAAVIIIPIVYGVFGFIGGAICAWIYNLCAKWIGGLQIEIK